MGNQEEKVGVVFKERKRWLFLGLPFTFTVYTVQEDKLTIQEGLLNQKTNDCYMYKVQDATLQRSLMERVFGLGTVVCFTGDTTHP
ncbi:MAG: PH domain-containing protein, partial [Mobilitalea sp.]